MIIRCLDVETTGLELPDAAVCEIGWCDILLHEDGRIEVLGPGSTLVKPPHSIPPAMSAIHHIVDGDVVDAPPLNDAIAIVQGGAPEVYAAHHATFERKFLTLSAPWICSYKVAITLAPSAPEYKLQTLRYWSKLDVDPALASPPHRAGPDAYVCACLLARMLPKMPAEDMIRVSAAPVLLPRLHFGEHAGKPIEEVPWSYFNWIVHKSKGPWDEDVMHTAKHHLARLTAAQRSRSPV